MQLNTIHSQLFVYEAIINLDYMNSHITPLKLNLIIVWLLKNVNIE